MKPAPEKLDFKAVLPVFIIVIIDLMGFSLFIPLLSLYAATFGADEFLIGVLAATYPLMQFVGAPILGQLSDRYGRKPVLILSQIGTLAGFLLLGVANSLLLVFLSRAIDGISGGNISVAQAAITDKTTPATRTQGLGLIGAAFGIGFVIGPIISFIVLAVTDDNFALVAFVAAGFSLVSLILTTFWFQETLEPGKRQQDTGRRAGFGTIVNSLRTPVIGFLLVLVALQTFSFSAVEQFFSIFTLSRLGIDGARNAALFVVIGLILVAVQGYFVGRWSQRFGERKLILAGLLVLGTAMIGTSLTPGIPVPWYDRAEVEANLRQSEEASLQLELPADGSNGWLGFAYLLVMMVPLAAAAGVLTPSINSSITQQVSPEAIGNVLGTSTALASLSRVLSPLFFGFIFQSLGTIIPFMLGGLLLLVAAGLAFRQLQGESG